MNNGYKLFHIHHLYLTSKIQTAGKDYIPPHALTSTHSQDFSLVGILWWWKREMLDASPSLVHFLLSNKALTVANSNLTFMTFTWKIWAVAKRLSTYITFIHIPSFHNNIDQVSLWNEFPCEMKSMNSLVWTSTILITFIAISLQCQLSHVVKVLNRLPVSDWIHICTKTQRFHS